MDEMRQALDLLDLEKKEGWEGGSSEAGANSGLERRGTGRKGASESRILQVGSWFVKRFMTYGCGHVSRMCMRTGAHAACVHMLMEVGARSKQWALKVSTRAG